MLKQSSRNNLHVSSAMAGYNWKTHSKSMEVNHNVTENVNSRLDIKATPNQCSGETGMAQYQATVILGNIDVVVTYVKRVDTYVKTKWQVCFMLNQNL